MILKKFMFGGFGKLGNDKGKWWYVWP